MPIPYTKAAQVPDEIEVQQILIAPQSGGVWITVALLKKEAYEVPQPDDADGNPVPPKQETRMVRIGDSKQIPLSPEEAKALSEAVPEGATVYEVIKNAVHAHLEANFTV